MAATSISTAESLHYAGQKRDVTNDLFNNCTIQELEALEMIIRNKKPDYAFTAGRAVPHEDNVDMSVLDSKH